ncbi:helix-turn-helix transcriptional regulator [Kosakonia cowanii]|uniref:helix-turn-helix transcriptional regulator n=1 Tax=Kosakonia cowanii TaxID=208223 RepID=UPI003D97A1A6
MNYSHFDMNLDFTKREYQDFYSRFGIYMDLRRGGKAAIERMLEAYGFTTKQALCQQLEISSSTLANRYLRDTFPADYVIQCALETGASLQWLVTGESNLDGYVRQKKIILKKPINNQLENIGSYKVDMRVISDSSTNIFALLLNNGDIYLISSSLKNLKMDYGSLI